MSSFAFQSQEMLSNLESASVRIVKPPQHHSSSTGRTVPSSLLPQAQQHSLVGASPVGSSSSSIPAHGPSCGPTPDSAGGLRMATIREDSSDSHLGEEGLSDDFPTAGACSSATKSSYEDLTDQTRPAKDRRRLKRQECIDTKETECWERPTSTNARFREHTNTKQLDFIDFVMNHSQISVESTMFCRLSTKVRSYQPTLDVDIIQTAILEVSLHTNLGH